MNTINNILNEVMQQDLSNRCTAETPEKQLVFNKYTTVEQIENKISKVLNNKGTRFNYLMGISHIRYDENTDKFLFVNNRFNKTVIDWEWLDETVQFEWVKVDNEYVIGNGDNEIIKNIFQNLLPKIILL
jgi:hypothetical protein